MPNASLSPGVYVEELPSGTRTIQAAATAITAFVGRTPMGAGEPTLVDSYSAYASSFGGLDPACTMRLVVRDFFNNGGRQAVILRLFKPSTAAGARDRALIVLPNLVLVAASRGSWANALRVRIEPSALAADLFTLSVCHTPPYYQIGAQGNDAFKVERTGAADARNCYRCERIVGVFIRANDLRPGTDSE